MSLDLPPYSSSLIVLKLIPMIRPLSRFDFANPQKKEEFSKKKEGGKKKKMKKMKKEMKKKKKG